MKPYLDFCFVLFCYIDVIEKTFYQVCIFWSRKLSYFSFKHQLSEKCPGIESKLGPLLCVFIQYLEDRWLKSVITPVTETPRHGDIVADKENILRTVFV